MSAPSLGTRKIQGLASPHQQTPSPTYPQSPTVMKTSMSSESSGVSSRKSSSDNLLLDGKGYVILRVPDLYAGSWELCCQELDLAVQLTYTYTPVHSHAHA